MLQLCVSFKELSGETVHITMDILIFKNVAVVSTFAIGVASIIIIVLLRRRKTGSKRTVPRDTVLLYDLGRGVAAPGASPFPLKLETFCRMAGIPYMVDHSKAMSSKGKSPWMIYNGQAVADSQFCIEHLKAERDIDLDRDLSPSLKAQARAFRELTEENLYWTMCHELFIVRPELLKRVLPYRGVQLWVVKKALGRVIRQEMWGHGMGRHSDTEIWHIAVRDLTALSDYLDDKKFFLGDDPHEVDCAIFGMLSQLLSHMVGSRHYQFVTERLPNLVAYVERMRARYWPDWNKLCLGDQRYVDDAYTLYTPKQSNNNLP